MPPWQWGVSLPLPNATYARLSWRNPPGSNLSVFPVDPTQKVTATFVANAVSPADGQPVNAVGSPQTLVGKMSFAGSGNFQSNYFPVPSGTQALLIFPDNANNLGSLDVFATIAVGEISQSFLYSGTPLTTDPSATIVVEWPAYASYVYLNVGAAGLSGVTNIYVMASPVPLTSSPQRVSGAVDAHITSGAVNAIPIPGPVGVPLQVADVAVGTLGGFASQTLVAGVTGKVLTLFRFFVTWDGVQAGVAAAQLLSTLTTKIVADIPVNVAGPFPFDYYTGLALPAGEGLKLHNTNGGALPNINGILVYTLV